MIPADVASRLRLTLPDQPPAAQPATPVGKLTDVLSDLVPGQRVMAEIQALMPNGTYRAMITQRDVILALPFEAKTGDALELEVVESDGKLTLAFVATRSSAEQGSKGGESVSVSATLSQAGKLIGNLLGSVDEQGKRSQPTALSGNLPLVEEFPKQAAQLVPVLEAALTKSGMFYEAHQARWVEGKFPTEALLQEPQGKLSTALKAQQLPIPKQATDATVVNNIRTAADTASSVTAPEPGSPQKSLLQEAISSDLAPLVRQQLDALATQNFVWQGQIWPGQHMHWEIEEHEEHSPVTEENPEQQWHTRLKLTLPGLGGIDAVMRLRAGGAIDVSLVTDSTESRQKFATASGELRQQLEDAGLKLTGLVVQHGEIPS